VLTLLVVRRFSLLHLHDYLVNLCPLEDLVIMIFLTVSWIFLKPFLATTSALMFLLINITMVSGGGEGAGQLAYWPQQIS
jgi:hypothetical protein